MFGNRKTEIRNLQTEIDFLNKKIKEQEEIISRKNDEYSKLSEKNRNNVTENIELRSQIEKLEKENAVMREYYELDKELSDEIKTKIHIDLEINRLKEKINELMMMNGSTNAMLFSQARYSMPYYSFGRPYF